jgi:hypothetical protein
MREYIENIQQVSINKMIAEYLNCNIHKFSNSSHLDIIRKPNLENTSENEIRWSLFNQFWLFNRFIPHCDWFECDLLFPECLNQIEIISEESWFENPREENRLSIKLDFNSIQDKTHKIKIDEFVNKGIEQSINEKRLILIGKYNQNTISLIDGNHRFMALYEAHKQNHIESFKIKIIVGFTFGNCRWLGDYEKWEERPAKENEKRYILNTW